MSNLQKDGSKQQVDLYKITPFDIILIIFILLLATGIILRAKLGLNWQSAEVTKASVYHKGKLNRHFDLSRDQEIVLLDGKMLVEIKGKKIRVKKSECPRQLCVNIGWIQHTGENIICVPFKTLIEIKSGVAPVVDAVVY